MGSCSPTTNVSLILRSEAKNDIEILRDKLEKDSENGALNNCLGKALFKLENYREAEYYLCKAINLKDYDFETFYLLGLINENSGIKQQAINYYLKAYEINKTSLDNLRRISEYYLYEYNFIKSKLFLEKYLNMKSDDLEIINLFGLCLINVGENEEAIKYLEGAFEYMKEECLYHYKIYNILGTAYRNLKDYDRATHYYLKASKTNNRMITNIAFFNIGNLYLEIGDYSNGLNFIEKVIASYEISEHLLNKGINWFFTNKIIKEAIIDYSLNKKRNCIIKLKEIYKQEENNIVVNFLIANSYFIIKKIQKAKCFYDKIILKQNLDYRNLLKKMVIKSENVLKIIDTPKYNVITSNDLDNLIENKVFESIDDFKKNEKFGNMEINCKTANYENILNNNGNIINDYTVVEILDSKNSIKKRTFETIKKKFLSDLNKN